MNKQQINTAINVITSLLIGIEIAAIALRVVTVKRLYQSSKTAKAQNWSRI